jgi:hypothetical protein
MLTVSAILLGSSTRIAETFTLPREVFTRSLINLKYSFSASILLVDMEAARNLHMHVWFGYMKPDCKLCEYSKTSISRLGPQISDCKGQMEYLKVGRAFVSISLEQVIKLGLQKVGEFKSKYPSQQNPCMLP